jgi:hypothetical protein
LIGMLCFTLEATHLWLARVQLENALESAALSAVRTWGEAGGGATEEARRVGVAFASYNAVQGSPVSLGLNYLPEALGGDPNENDDACEGDLIFGAVSDNGLDQWRFDSDVAPTCGQGSVLVDATGIGNLSSGNLHEWGVAFLNADGTRPNLRICSVTISLPPRQGFLDWYFDPQTFGFSDNGSNIFDNIRGCRQNDVVGLDTSRINVQFLTPAPCSGLPGSDDYFKQLRFTFPLDAGPDEFAPCDRFRFGANVRAVTPGCNAFSQADGDLVGSIGTQVTVVFADSGDGSCDPADPARSVTVPLLNLTWSNRSCTGVDVRCSGAADPLNDSHILSPPGIPNLPDGALRNNPFRDGQSYALAEGPGGSNAFGVRAQATVAVPSLCAGFCGLNLPFEVRAKTTAIFECTGDNARLIRILPQNFRQGICPSP